MEPDILRLIYAVPGDDVERKRRLLDWIMRSDSAWAEATATKAGRRTLLREVEPKYGGLKKMADKEDWNILGLKNIREWVRDPASPWFRERPDARTKVEWFFLLEFLSKKSS
jgi:hypothetical protein